MKEELVITVPEGYKKYLDDMANKINVKDRVDVIKKGLYLLKTVTEAIERGETVAICDIDNIPIKEIKL